MVDICCGNISLPDPNDFLKMIIDASDQALRKANYGMRNRPTNPIDFLINKMKVSSVFRFILTHPDMDHLDGFNALMTRCSVANFWDNGIRREKPDFENCSYKEEDWDRYVKVRNGKDGVTVIGPKAGATNKYWNQNDDGAIGGDFIWICAPDVALVKVANENGEINDASYVISLYTSGGRIVLPGDAHDNTWQFIVKHHLDAVKDCEFMLAPHHGRDSDRDFTFLDKVQPRFTLFGCASSEHLAYDQWNRRNLEKVTQNQTGNVAIYPVQGWLNIYVENEIFAKAYGGNTAYQDAYGNYFLKAVQKSN